MSIEKELQQQIRDLQRQLALLSNKGTDTSVASSIPVKLPSFWEDNPTLWFAQAECLFELAGVTQDSTKYGHILSVMDMRLAEMVEDVIANPPMYEKYEKLKGELIYRLSSSKEQKVRQLLSEEKLRDRKPTAFLRHLRSLAGSNMVDEDILRELWIRRLPDEVQRILKDQHDLPLDNVAQIADSILDTLVNIQSPSSTVTVNATSKFSDNYLENINRRLLKLSVKIDALTAQRSYQRARSKSRVRSKSPSGRLCWYHKKFSAKAHKCIAPCNWESKFERNARGSQ